VSVTSQGYEIPGQCTSSKNLMEFADRVPIKNARSRDALNFPGLPNPRLDRFAITSTSTSQFCGTDSPFRLLARRSPWLGKLLHAPSPPRQCGAVLLASATATILAGLRARSARLLNCAHAGGWRRPLLHGTSGLPKMPIRRSLAGKVGYLVSAYRVELRQRLRRSLCF
jgi:hypothetical protein